MVVDCVQKGLELERTKMVIEALKRLARGEETID